MKTWILAILTAAARPLDSNHILVTMPFKFTGELKKATVYLKPAPLTAQDQRKLEDGKAAAAVAAQ